MPSSSFEKRDRVQFSDTDMAGIVHFSNFYRYMERAEHAFYRSLGFSVVEREGGPFEVPEGERVGWPRVHSSCDYRAPLFFEEEFTTRVLVEKIGGKTLTLRFGFFKLDGSVAAVGKLIIACVQKGEGKKYMSAVPVPQRILDQLEVAPAAEIEALVGGAR